MAKTYLVDINLGKNELQNARVQNLASAPSAAVEGQIYYDTTVDKFGIYNGTTWDYVGTGAGAGSVTSVAVSGSDGIEIDSGSPITTSGTIALGINAASLRTHINVENGADVTDSANVTSAGAIMDGDFSSNGSMTRTGSGTYVSRTLTGTTNRITVTNGDGVSGNPTFDVGSNVYTVGGTDVSVADGGTGRSTSTTAYGLIAAGTTATGAHQTISPGTSGMILKSNGASALASFQTGAKGDVGLGNVDNTSDANKPVSTATQTALDLKANLASPTFTGTVTVPTPTNATDAATKGYVDTAVTGLLDFKGSTDASANPNYPAALMGDTYVVSVAGRIGGASGKQVEVGDMYVATANNAGGTEASVGASWTVLEHNLQGALLSSNNLSDVASASTAFTNIKQDATTTSTGVVELATQAEAQAKTDTTRALTAASVADFTRKYVGTIGNGSLTSLPVTHGLGTQFVTAQVFDATSNAMVECDVVSTSSTVTTFIFNTAPSTNQYRVVIVG